MLVQEPLAIPGVELAGKRVLVCSCGSGNEPVQATRAGADVWAFDISSVAVQKAHDVARLNEQTIRAAVVDFHALSFPDACFDVIYGSSILHHVNCATAGREILRCLKPGGVAFFWENSDRNVILRLARRAMFGSPGQRQRTRWLWFRRTGTSDEYPLTEQEVAVLDEIFGGRLERVYEDFMFVRLFSLFGWNRPAVSSVTEAVDALTVRICFWLMRYSFAQGVRVTKV